MFLRRYQRRKNGKPHTYWALAESYRTAQGSRQRIVAYLGELSADERDGWTRLSSHLNGEADKRRPQLALFDPPRRDEPQDDEPLLVKLSSVRLERTRDFGDVWLAWGLWRMLELDQLLERLIEPGREDVSWATVAAILVMARLCEPSSELHIADTWYRRTALDESGDVSGDVTLAARSPRNGEQRQIALRCVTEPDAGQAVLLQRLGLALPRRLRRLDTMIPM